MSFHDRGPVISKQSAELSALENPMTEDRAEPACRVD